MRVSRRLLLLSTLPLALAACGKSGELPSLAPSEPEFGIPASQPVSLEVIRAFSLGFDSGTPMSIRHVFVFFDPQCPHCAMLWAEAKLMPTVRFTWLPVALLGPASLTQGAHLLEAPNHQAAMDAHEAALRLGVPMPAAQEASPQFKAAVTKNTRLLASFGADGVPFIVAQHATSGQLFTRAGGMKAAALAQALGWQAP